MINPVFILAILALAFCIVSVITPRVPQWIAVLLTTVTLLIIAAGYR